MFLSTAARVRTIMTVWSADAVLTDLDGVLAASISAVEEAWRWWALEVDLDPEVVLEGIHGTRATDIIRRVAPNLDASVEVERLVERELALVHRTRKVPGAAALVRTLPDSRWAVVTSGPRQLAAARLAAVGHRVPKVLIAAEDVIHGKPQPEGYLLAASRLETPAPRCVVIEDAPAGVEAGKAAGATVIAVTTSHRPDDLEAADAVVSSLQQIQVQASGVGLDISIEY